MFIISCSVICYKKHKEECLKQINTTIEDKNKINNNRKLSLNLDENEDIILEENQLNKLLLNKSICKKLSNQKLRKIIKLINNAKFKSSLLSKTIKNDKEFKSFADEILIELGYKKGNIVEIN